MKIVVRSERLVTAGLVYRLNIHQASLFVLVSKCECLFLALWLASISVCLFCTAGRWTDMLRASEGMTGRPMKPKSSPRSTLTSVLQYLGKPHNIINVFFELYLTDNSEYSVISETRPATHVQRPHRTPGLQVQPPRRLLSSLPSHGPHGMLGKRSYHHHSRVESAERRASAPGQGGFTVKIQTTLKNKGSKRGVCSDDIE